MVSKFKIQMSVTLTENDNFVSNRKTLGKNIHLI